MLPPLPELIQAGLQTSLPTALVPLSTSLSQRPGRHLVLDRHRRRLFVLEDGSLLDAFPVAVGMPGWETPTGDFSVISKIPRPVWQHPANHTRVMPGPDNPLGSRWIGFHRDCKGRDAHDGDTWLKIEGCVTAGFHGTYHRWTVGLAVSADLAPGFAEGYRGGGVCGPSLENIRW